MLHVGNISRDVIRFMREIRRDRANMQYIYFQLSLMKAVRTVIESVDRGVDVIYKSDNRRWFDSHVTNREASEEHLKDHIKNVEIEIKEQPSKTCSTFTRSCRMTVTCVQWLMICVFCIFKEAACCTVRSIFHKALNLV